MVLLSFKREYRFFNRIIFAITLIAFMGTSVLLPQTSFGQSVFSLPQPGTMLTLSPGFNPPIIKGMTIHPENPLQFDFIVNKGDKNLSDQELRQESLKMIKYFLACVTVPNDEMWVNLSPYEKNRIIAQGLGMTQLGRDLLGEDYLLKQLTASLMHPENEIGKKFWAKIYKEAQEKYRTTDVPVYGFNKVWIVPDKAVVMEHGRSVFVVERHLKVMLEQDYLALSHSVIASERSERSPAQGGALSPSATRNDTYSLSSQIIREIVIPQLTKEVNEGTTFANLRQVYNAMILATWYKQSLRTSLLAKVYADKNKVSGVDVNDKQVVQKIYRQYLQAFKKGVYNFVKEEYDPVSQQMISRKYFSGGIVRVQRVDRTNFAMMTGGQRAEFYRDAAQNVRVTADAVDVGTHADAASVADVENQAMDVSKEIKTSRRGFLGLLGLGAIRLLPCSQGGCGYDKLSPTTVLWEMPRPIIGWGGWDPTGQEPFASMALGIYFYEMNYIFFRTNNGREAPIGGGSKWISDDVNTGILQVILNDGAFEPDINVVALALHDTLSEAIDDYKTPHRYLVIPIRRLAYDGKIGIEIPLKYLQQRGFQLNHAVLELNSGDMFYPPNTLITAGFASTVFARMTNRGSIVPPQLGSFPQGHKNRKIRLNDIQSIRIINGNIVKMEPMKVVYIELNKYKDEFPQRYPHEIVQEDITSDAAMMGQLTGAGVKAKALVSENRKDKAMLIPEDDMFALEAAVSSELAQYAKFLESVPNPFEDPHGKLPARIQQGHKRILLKADNNEEFTQLERMLDSYETTIQSYVDSLTVHGNLRVALLNDQERAQYKKLIGLRTQIRCARGQDEAGVIIANQDKFRKIIRQGEYYQSNLTIFGPDAPVGYILITFAPKTSAITDIAVRAGRDSKLKQHQVLVGITQNKELVIENRETQSLPYLLVDSIESFFYNSDAAMNVPMSGSMEKLITTYKEIMTERGRSQNEISRILNGFSKEYAHFSEESKMAVFLIDIMVPQIYITLRAADYSYDLTGVAKVMGLAIQPQPNKGIATIKEDGWIMRGRFGNGDIRGSLNVHVSEGLINELDELISSQKLDGYYKLGPDSIIRRDSITVYFNKPPSVEVLEALGHIARKYLRDTDGLLGRKVSDGFYMSELGSINETHVISLIQQLRFIHRTLGSSVRTWIGETNRMSEGMYYALKQALSYVGIDLNYDSQKGFTLDVILSKDSAQISNVGGINLNANLLDLQIKRDKNGVPLPISDQPIENMKIQGFVPIIVSVQPVDLSLMFGDAEPHRGAQV